MPEAPTRYDCSLRYITIVLTYVVGCWCGDRFLPSYVPPSSCPKAGTSRDRSCRWKQASEYRRRASFAIRLSSAQGGFEMGSRIAVRSGQVPRRVCIMWLTLPSGLPHRLVEDDSYNGYWIPKGTTVYANIWSSSHVFLRTKN